ncbi:hypothetical protein EHW99_1912 [Erwinia amylovora]|uniref:Uncharacterized protein n=3 Tax=Erwinia amylovora TaxID=552 RepID=A0A831ESB8_ERWAM|nr:hypothetical protein EaACW_1679 [Erwinia amylovora ACW56400]QJQ54616.1 hypothetical protein EHX00_1912 [Erwinia amylovora]CBA20622.1 hypothetical protein predicted by Glimmer/Critica [Erwinia amylovora CFBP1430]CBX80544.1 hypothetical protein predicted by Glimmer/Critica [Erwinia amylovora ATCC BAA-2158]CCO82319.1 hypothetical protein BN433_1746 [Erwinia amylovora Ea266]CCO86106.1 hypothetical protein BN434_1715 [Erwinia amylovora CFBP 2585]CCO89896.1 hypothetical protein BN435_1722 [Erwin
MRIDCVAKMRSGSFYHIFLSPAVISNNAVKA